MFKSTATSLILYGILAIIVGIIAIAWPGVTILALVILFAIYAFIGTGLQAMRAFSSPTAGPVFGHLLLGLIDLAAGVIAPERPGVRRVRRRAVRPPRRRRGHPGAAIRPVQPDLRRLPDHNRHPTAPDRAHPALRDGERGLTQDWAGMPGSSPGRRPLSACQAADRLGRRSPQIAPLVSGVSQQQPLQAAL